MVFYITDTKVKYSFSRFIEMVITNVEHCGLMHKLIHSSFKRWTQSKVLREKLAEKARINPILTNPVSEIASCIYVVGTLAQGESTIKSKILVGLLSTALKKMSLTKHRRNRLGLGEN